MSVKILVVGGGGREHALAWKLSRSADVKVYAAPGNPGIAKVATCLPGPDPLKIATELDADVTVIGPEAPLVSGVVDRFRAADRKVVGPDRRQRTPGRQQDVRETFLSRAPHTHSGVRNVHDGAGST